MNLNNTGKKFVYLSIIMMALSMVLPWESLEDYTYAESVGIAFNILPAVLFVCSSLMVVLGAAGRRCEVAGHGGHQVQGGARQQESRVLPGRHAR